MTSKQDWQEAIKQLEGLLYDTTNGFHSPNDNQVQENKNDLKPIISDPNNIDISDVGEEDTLSAHCVLKKAIEKLKEKIK